MELTLSDPKVKKCPFETQDLIRSRSPAYRDPVTGFYLVTHFDEVRNLAGDTIRLSNHTGVLTTREGPNTEVVNKMFTELGGYLPMDTLTTCDPPDHRGYRALVEKAFTPKRVESMVNYIHHLCDELIDDFIARNRVEFVSEFAIKLPTIVIAEQLGFPREDAPLFKRWSDAHIELINPSLDLQRELDLTAMIIEMHKYFVKKVDAVRKEPADNIISSLVHSQLAGRSLSNRELCAILEILLVAGNETTTSALGSAMILLVEHSDLEDRLYAQPDLIGAFVEEVLRLRAPAPGILRRAKTDIDVRGVNIPQGALVQLMVGAANYDPSVFLDPYAVDLQRPSVQAHLSFGSGRHFCIGSMLARKEMAIALTEILKRMKNLRYADGANSVTYMEAYTYGPAKIDLLFDCR